MIACIVFCLMKTQAQNDTILTIEQVYNTVGRHVYVCADMYDRAIVQAPCNDCGWLINNNEIIENQSYVIFDGNVTNHYYCVFSGCGYAQLGFIIDFIEPNVPNDTYEEIWKRQCDTITLEAPEGSYDYLWNTGATTQTIDVTEPGTYTCGVSDMCATSVQTFIVKDNVECYRATVDLETSLNKVTWQTSPAQAEYISDVKVERDGMVVGTAPFEQGYFMDNIGSENAARNYRLTGITTDGTECPITSYQKGTLHVDYSPNASNPNKLNMAWTPPFIEEGASVSVTYFQICKYDPNTGEVTVIDQIGANNTIGSYDVNLFDGGYATVAALFSEGKDYEDLAFSNLTEEVLGIEEDGPSTDSGTLTIYPNPAKDCVTIEGSGTLTITNTLGQTILTKEIDDKTTIELPQGLYIVKFGGETRKIVVE